jgi:hypothetical protein
MPDKRKTYGFYVAGFVFIIISAIFLYFFYETSNQSRILAILSPVNRSQWENLKAVLWPAILFSFLEFLGYGFRNRNFFISKAVSFYAIPVLMASLSYANTYFLDRQALLTDMAVLVLSVLVGQVISYRVMIKSNESSANARLLSFILILLIVLVFTVFTFYPLKLPYFIDPLTGTYGVNGF